jgi:predicted dienelactone hydrolase
LIIFSHGLGLSSIHYTFILEELASHGFIVAAIEHTGRNMAWLFPDHQLIIGTKPFPENSSIEEINHQLDLEMPDWTSTIQFAIDQLQKINFQDPQHLFSRKTRFKQNWSFGGAAITQVCSTDNRVKAGVNMDGLLRGPNSTSDFGKPFLFLMNETFHKPRRIKERLLRWNIKTRELFNHLSHSAYEIIVKRSDHLSFCDWKIIQPIN